MYAGAVFTDDIDLQIQQKNHNKVKFQASFCTYWFMRYYLIHQNQLIT